MSSDLDVARRLKRARLDMGYRTQLEASRALRIHNSTYAAHENANRRLRRDMAEFYGRHFNVSPEWLLFGRGEAPGGGARDSVEPPAPEARPERSVQAARRETPRDTIEAAPYDIFQATWRQGRMVAANDDEEPIPLPPIRVSGGFLPELAVAAPQRVPDERYIIVSGDPAVTREPMAVKDLLRIPSDMVEQPRLFAFKLPRNELFPDMPGGERVFVDPDDIDVQMEGVFLALNETGKVAPAYIAPAKQDGLVDVYRSRFKKAAQMKKSDLDLLGRVVIVLKWFSELEVDAVAKAFRPSD